MRVRFAADPVWETVAALTALRTRGHPAQHQLRARAALVDRLDLQLLLRITAHPGWLPRLVTSGPGRPARDVGARLAEVAGAGNALLGFWTTVLQPVWERVDAIVAADLAERGSALARGGTGAVLASLHPDVHLAGNSLQIRVPGTEHAIRPSGAGIWCVPSVFRRSGVAITRSGPLVISYPAAGGGRVWAAEPGRAREPVAALVGRSRAAILAQLDVPRSTTALAARLGLSAGTVSEHLAVLTQARLLSARRDGRRVLYARTELGAALLDPTADDAGRVALAERA